jgi:hypothetical protein
MLRHAYIQTMRALAIKNNRVAEVENEIKHLLDESIN